MARRSSAMWRPQWSGAQWCPLKTDQRHGRICSIRTVHKMPVVHHSFCQPIISWEALMTGSWKIPLPVMVAWTHSQFWNFQLGLGFLGHWSDFLLLTAVRLLDSPSAICLNRIGVKKILSRRKAFDPRMKSWMPLEHMTAAWLLVYHP